jgi:hypothetical protein
MRILVACEFSGIVREAFGKRGHDTWSCDLLDTEMEGQHIKADIFTLFNPLILILNGKTGEMRQVNAPYYGEFDMMVAHPPCTHLAVSGARWFKGKEKEQINAINFFMNLMDLPIKKICIENPISIMSTKYRKPDQIIQPWQFGHGETKATCLWLKGLPLLKPTNIVKGRENKVHRMPPTKDRWKNRSRTYQGIADAMAEQWG